MNTIWKSAAGHVIGRSHEKEQKPCQDRTLVLKQEKISFIGLCDGAGSASHSELGAEQALVSVSTVLLNQFSALLELEEQQIANQLLDHILTELTILAEHHQLSLSSLASTLLFTISDGEHYISGHIGDGLIVELTFEGIAMVHSHADNGAYVNVTYFTTSQDALAKFRIKKGKINVADQRVIGFCLMSDGTSSSFYRKSDDSIAPAVTTIATWLKENDEQAVYEAIEQNLHKTIRNKTFDDCALAIMVMLET